MKYQKTRLVFIAIGIIGIVSSFWFQVLVTEIDVWKAVFLGGLLFLILGISPSDMINPIFDESRDTSEKRIQAES